MATLSRAAFVLVFCSANSWLWEYEDTFHQCYSDINITGARAMARKGITLDDVSLRYCASRIPAVWPNTRTPVDSLRLFRSWERGWPEERRAEIWLALTRYVRRNRIKVLVATPISCSVADDDQDWEWTQMLIRRLGPDHIMGFAVGNELDLLYTHAKHDPGCLQRLWDGGGLWAQFTRRVQQVDEMGYSRIPVTSVFTGAVLYGGTSWAPFMNVPGKALVNDFLLNATKKYGYRFTFTFNIYTYFDPALVVNPPRHTCKSGLHIATCFDNHCLAIIAFQRSRRLMQRLTGRPDDRLWIGEIGWSSPKADALGTQMAYCPDFSSTSAFALFYGNFLRWDLSVSGVRDPDHVFYFTMRDALNFGNQEHFGLMDTCQSVECKIRTANYTAPPVLRGKYLPGMRITFFVVGAVLMAISCCNVCGARNAKVADNGEDSDSGDSASG